MLSTAARIASFVISWKTMRLTGTFGLSASSRCHAMASPSRSSSVASRSSSAFFRARFSSATVFLPRSLSTYSGVNPFSMSIEYLPTEVFFSSAGMSFLSARSRMCPTELSTSYPSPR